MKKPTVYLAGPMTGLDRRTASNWRKYVKNQLADFADCIDPMDVDPALETVDVIPPSLSDRGGTSDRDLFQHQIISVRNSDLVLANFIGAPATGFGTPFELGVAFEVGIPIVVVCSGKLAKQVFVRECADWGIEYDESDPIQGFDPSSGLYLRDKDILDRSIEAIKELLSDDREVRYRLTATGHAYINALKAGGNLPALSADVIQACYRTTEPPTKE